MNQLRAFLKRRAPGNSPFATKRKEPDLPIPVRGVAVWGGGTLPVQAGNPGQVESDQSAAILSGDSIGNHAQGNAVPSDSTSSADNTSSFAQGADDPGALAEAPVIITAKPLISFEIRNTDTRSGDYKGLRAVPRPGHADYTARLRYGDSLNMAGGGPFSARMTAPLCIAGGIALQMLEEKNIEIGAHLYAIAGIKDTPLDPVNVTAAELESLQKMEFPVLSEDAGEKMAEAILQAKKDLDSVGGVVEVCATGLPGGIGGAMYDGLESYLAPIFFGIPAVKGVEFGAGFHAAELRGSENNDSFYYDNQRVKTRTNCHGGILGGITTRHAADVVDSLKPTPSISREQDSVDLEAHKNEKLVVKGRHDPCVAVRAVPITEAALALGILGDCIMGNKMTDINLDQMRQDIDNIDEKLTDLFKERMEKSLEIAKYKKDHKVPVFSDKREKEILHKVSEQIGEPLTDMHSCCSSNIFLAIPAVPMQNKFTRPRDPTWLAASKKR